MITKVFALTDASSTVFDQYVQMASTTNEVLLTTTTRYFILFYALVMGLAFVMWMVNRFSRVSR